LGGDIRDTGYVALWSRHACDEPNGDGVADTKENDRDCSGRSLRDLGRWRSSDRDNVRRKPYQLFDRWRQLVRRFACGSRFERDALTFDAPGPAKRAKELLMVASGGRDETYNRDLYR